MSSKILIATEAQEMEILAQWLDLHKLTWCHVPNERKCTPARGARMKRQGVKSGVPDVLIFNQTPYGCIPHKSIECVAAQAVGVAIELKRKGGKTTKAQDDWLRALANCGWYTAVCYGADEAIKLLMSLGYGGGE